MGIIDRIGYAVVFVGLGSIEVMIWISDQWCKVAHKKDAIRKVYISLDDNIPDDITYQCYKCSRTWEEENV